MERGELEALLELAADKGHTPSRRQMWSALAWLDHVDRHAVAALESLIQRCDSAPKLERLEPGDWHHPERALRLLMRRAEQDPAARQRLEAAVQQAVTSPRTALFRQALRAMGRFHFAEPMHRALQDPRVLAEPGLKRIALEMAARCAGQDPRIAAWVREHADPQSRAWVLAQREQDRGTRADVPWQMRPGAKWLAGLEIRLRCKDGAQDWLWQEVHASPGIERVSVERGAVWVRAREDRPYGEVMSWRCAIDHAFVLRNATLGELATDPRMRAQLHELYGDASIRFRLALRGQGTRAVWEQSAALARAWQVLVNEPRQSPLELGADADRSWVWARPRLRDQDRRFAYRVAEIPAASHPSVAAGLVRAAKLNANDRIWDPFAGSGLELIEAGLLAAPQLLMGTDLDASALEKARANADAAGVNAQWVHADARSVQLPLLTKVISNPPHGRRVAQGQDLAALYADVLTQAYGALVPGGEVHWLTPQPQWGAQRIAALGGRSEVLARIDLGGLVVHHQRLVKDPRAPGRAGH